MKNNMFTRKGFLTGGVALVAGGVGTTLAQAEPAGSRVTQVTPNVRFKDLQTVKMLTGGGRVYALSSRIDTISLSTVFVSPEGKILVVDGGHYPDGAFLGEFLRALGGHVDYWFLTHAHEEHFGALIAMTDGRPDKGGVSIGELIYNFPERQWMETLEKSSKPHIENFYTNLINGRIKGVRHGDCSPGRVVKFGSWSFEILNAPLKIDRNPINNATVMLSVKAGGKTWLETGDLGVEAGRVLMGELGARLKHDIVFLAHHGQRGVDKDFYAAVAPEAAVWPLPSWLWDNRVENGTFGSGAYRTNYTKCWMQDLGVKKNYVLLKDYVFA